MDNGDATKIIWVLFRGSFVLQPILCVRLLVAGLQRPYAPLILYILAQWVQTVLMAYCTTKRAYGQVWIISQVIVLILESGVVLSIFGRWTFSYPGIGTFGRSLLTVLMLIATGLSLATLPIAWSAGGWELAYQLTSLVNRVMNACFAFFLALTLGFFYKFGGPVAPNLAKYSWSMAALVSANAISYYILTLHVFLLANMLLPSVTLAALAFWIFAFRKAGEAQPVTASNEQEWAVAAAMNTELQKLAVSVKLTSRGVKEQAKERR